MNLVTIHIQVDPQDNQRTYLNAHIAHGNGSRRWQGTYEGDPIRASLGGIWLALRELDHVRLHKCVVNLKCNQATRDVIEDFLWQSPHPEELLNAYEHLRPLLRKHTILLPERQGMRFVSSEVQASPEELIDEMRRHWGHRGLRTRLPRAAQLVSMGAVQCIPTNPWGWWGRDNEWEVFSQTIPNGETYLVKPVKKQGQVTYQCNCLDSSPICKHILAVNMQCNLLLGPQQGE